MDQKRDRANDSCMTNHTRRDPAQYLALLARRETERLTFAQLSEESGTRDARRAMNSYGVIKNARVPSRHGRRSFHEIIPSARQTGWRLP